MRILPLNPFAIFGHNSLFKGFKVWMAHIYSQQCGLKIPSEFHS